jgi:hypothetical protein
MLSSFSQAVQVFTTLAADRSLELRRVGIDAIGNKISTRPS